MGKYTEEGKIARDKALAIDDEIENETQEMLHKIIDIRRGLWD